MSVWDELNFFKKSKFDCRCGCGRNEMQPSFLTKLDVARSRVDFPWVVTSGYRCPDYNARVSSTGRTGPHTTGRAVDIAVSGAAAFSIVASMVVGGWMTGIGLKQHGPHRKRFIHLDDLEPTGLRTRPTVWTYMQ